MQLKLFTRKVKLCSYLCHNFSGYDCNSILETLIPKAFELKLESKILPKRMETYISVQKGCLRILDSNRYLRASLDNLVKNKLLWIHSI